MLRELRRLIRKFRGTSLGWQTALQQSHYGETAVIRPAHAINTTSASPMTNAAWTSFHTNTIAAMVSDPARLAQMTDEANRELLAAGKESKEPIRIEKKPVEIVAEIMLPQPVMALNDLKKQIAIVERRLAILKQFKGMTSDEVQALRYLHARQHYEKNKRYFPWALTTDEKITKLLEIYKVQRVSFSSYSKSVPHEATDELALFADAWERVVDDEEYGPKVELITDYQGPEHKKDPILFASSPFGKWYYVLGAWDKEVEIVDDLVYKGK